MISKKALVSFLLIFSFFVSPRSALAEDGKSIIDRTIQNIRSHANIATYQMTIERPNWTRALKLKVWDGRRDNKIFVRILEPAKERGTSFLRIGYNLWTYLPNIEKEMKIPPSMMLQPWMGSDFTNDDLVKESSYVDDYTHEVIGHETRAEKEVWKVELTPKPNAPVVWGKVVYWIWKKEYLPVEQSFFDEKGDLIKHLTLGEFKQVDGVLRPTRLLMKTVKKENQQTTLDLLDIDYDPSPPIPDFVFTKQHFRKSF